VVVGMVEVGDLDDKRHSGACTARWILTPPKYAASERVPTAEMAIPAEMTALEETMLE